MDLSSLALAGRGTQGEGRPSHTRENMQKLRNDFTDQMVILVAILIPSIIGSWIGGGGGFFIGLIIAVPITIGVIRYVEGTFPGMKSKASR